MPASLILLRKSLPTALWIASVTAAFLAFGCGIGSGDSLRVGESVEVVSPLEDSTQVFPLTLAAGDFVRIEALQRGVDLILRLRGPAGEVLQEVDRRTWDRGPELLLFLALEPGEYQVEAQAARVAEGGDYSLGVVEHLSGDAVTAAHHELAAIYESFLHAKAARRTQGIATTLTRLEEIRSRLESPGVAVLGVAALEGEVLDEAGLLRHGQGDFEVALEAFRLAAERFATAGDPLWEGLAQHHRGGTLIDLLVPTEALDAYWRVLELGREAKSWQLVGNAHDGLGHAYQQRGELQKALDHYERALEVWKADHGCINRADTAHNLAVLYRRGFHKPEKALNLLAIARSCWEEHGAEDNLARTLGQVGQAHVARGAYAPEAYAEAEESFLLALEASRHSGSDDKSCRQALLQARRAGVAQRLEQIDRASALAERAQALLDAAGECGVDGVHTRRELGELYAAQNRPDAALAAYQAYLGYARDIGSRLEEARAHTGIARMAQARDDLGQALASSADAVAILLDLRPELERDDLRTSFFASVQEAFGLRVEILMNAGKPLDALEVAESARARSFKDRLAEVGIDLTRGAASELLLRAADLKRRIAEASERSSLLARPSAAEDPQSANELLDELERVEGRIRSVGLNRDLASSTEPLRAREMQALLASGEQLLFYFLGEGRSYLWSLDAQGFQVFELPGRGEIEAMAETAVEDLRHGPIEGGPAMAACLLSRMVLGPVAKQLVGSPGRSLLIVGDGALHFVPFAALPLVGDEQPCQEAALLVRSHAISYLPSISALGLLRASQPPALPPGSLESLAALGDPVYGSQDPRCSTPSPPGEFFLPRLEASGEEAKAICGLLGGDCYLGFEANRGLVLDGGLEGYRILLLAVHGEPDPAQPLLSRLALSRRDQQCHPRSGWLYAYEIADLGLHPDLVVLSACESGIGAQVPGEGLVSGLVRGFFSAGASRVMASLWRVDDRSTQELMVGFFSLLEEGLAPAEALRQAQLIQVKKGRAPLHWAAFVLHGVRDPLPLPLQKQ